MARPLRVTGKYVDQVRRQQEYEAVHPLIKIDYVGGGAFQAVMPADDGGTDIITRYELQNLLDELERRCGCADGKCRYQRALRCAAA